MGGFYTVESCVSFAFFKESTLAAVYSRLEEEGEASGVWTQGVYIQ